MSRLTDTIGLLYRMADADAATLEDVLLESAKQAWLTAMAKQAKLHKCAGTPNAPRREDLAELRRITTQDAASITRTYNREVTREIERLYAANHRGNRNYYYSNLERWNAKRNLWKAAQIAITTETVVRAYAQRRFREMNYSGGERFVFSGPPPTCERCVKLFAAGIVTADYIRKHPTPVHIACPHGWKVTRPPKLDCADVWLG